MPMPGSLSLINWNKNLNGFPSSLFPATDPTKQFMRSGAAPAFEQMQCVLRPVGTIGAPAMAGGVPSGVSDAMINVLELRADMKTGAQGSGTQGANDFTFGYNPPSLLGLQVGAPYFHAGNARTLEEVLTVQFKGHYQALASTFLGGAAPDPTMVKQLVAYLLSIDGAEPAVTIPPKGSAGGDLCSLNP